VIFVLGGPGAGKGTMCAKLVEDFGFEHLSAGDLLRAERKKGGERGELINDYIARGAIVPNEITCQLLLDAMTTSPRKKFLVDGYPRNADNREGWDATVGDDVELAAVLYFDCPEDVLVGRIIKRGEQAGPNARIDDNAEAMVKRLQVFREQTGPVIAHFDKAGKVVRVNTSYSPAEVYEGVAKAVTPIVEAEVLAANHALLDIIHEGDYDGYARLTSEDVTCFDLSETGGNLVEGQRHLHHFAASSKAREPNGGRGGLRPRRAADGAHPHWKACAELDCLRGDTRVAGHRRCLEERALPQEPC